MYFPYFATYMLSGLVVSLIVFIWAAKNGQFADQARARYLPLEDEPETAPAAATRISRIETYGLILLAVLGLSATAAVLIFSIAFH